MRLVAEEASAGSEDAATVLRPARADTRAGLLLADRYRVMERLGKGGMSAVYRAVDRLEGVEYAVKFLDRRFTIDPDMARRCQREARAMAEIESRHVPRAFLVGTTSEGEIYLVMEFLRGRDLDLVLTQGGPLPWRRAVAIGLQICEALAAAHARNIVHRDIKPSNCFLVEGNEGTDDFVKLIDFGIAKDLEASGEQTGLGLVLGTPGYVAPELFAGEVRASAATDVYGLGVTLYKLLTGRLPWTPGSPVDVAYAQVHEIPRPLHELVPGAFPASAAAAVMQAFARDPAQRFRSVEEVAAALRGALEEPRAVPPSGAARVEATPAIGRHGRHLALVVATVACLFGGAWSLAPGPKPGRGGSGRVPLAAVRRPPPLSAATSPVPAQDPVEPEAAPQVAATVPIETSSRETPAPAVGSPSEPTSRPFQAGLARSQLDRRRAEMRANCAPLLRGTDRMRFTVVVRPDGSVAEVKASPDALRQCVTELLKAMTFAASDDGGQVSYTLRLADRPKQAPEDDLLPVGRK